MSFGPLQTFFTFSCCFKDRIHNFVVKVQTLWKKKTMKEKKAVQHCIGVQKLELAYVTDWVAQSKGGGVWPIRSLLDGSALILEWNPSCVERPNWSGLDPVRARLQISDQRRVSATISPALNEQPHVDPSRGGKHMFSGSTLAGYLQRGLGIPPAGGRGGCRGRGTLSLPLAG